MIEFLPPRGAVYIFENSKAQRVKVGMTINNVYDRLRDVNNMWLKRKPTCQICGGRRFINNKGLIPHHVVSGTSCLGGEALPIESDISLAESHLGDLKNRIIGASGDEKGSITRKIKTLEKRIELYKAPQHIIGLWRFSTAFYTECAEQVEALSHETLADTLDRLAPFGEVFTCSVTEATQAVESALKELGLIDSARKEIKSYVTSEEYGKCVICGNNLTATGACPPCIERFLD